jgi:RNA-directed DNA polymerase
LLDDIKKYLTEQLHLQVKSNYQVFPIEARGLDFVGYVFYHTHTRLRKTIKKNFARAAAAGRVRSIAAYYGWAKHCNSGNLLKKLAA